MKRGRSAEESAKMLIWMTTVSAKGGTEKKRQNEGEIQNGCKD